jgi:hypothetical protein
MVYKESRGPKHQYKEKHGEDIENKRSRNTKKIKHNTTQHNTTPMERRGWELPVAAREDHAPPLEDRSPTVVARSFREPPTIGAGEGWREKRGHHVLESETHSLARACLTLVRGCRERALLVSVETKDAGEHYRKTRVVQKLTDELRFRSTNFDLRT